MCESEVTTIKNDYYVSVSRALGLCSAQTATLRKQDFRLTWSAVVKWCRAMIGHSEGLGRGEGQGVFGPSFHKGFFFVSVLRIGVVYLFSLHPHLGASDRPDQCSGGSDRRQPLSV